MRSQFGRYENTDDVEKESPRAHKYAAAADLFEDGNHL